MENESITMEFNSIAMEAWIIAMGNEHGKLKLMYMSAAITVILEAKNENYQTCFFQ
jgi:hypothetical protein